MIITTKNSARTVLIVEDEKPLRDVYSIILEKAGYTVRKAANGREGVDEVNADEPDFVLLDIMMPIMNGIDFMKTVDMAKRPNMKVVVFSNNSDSGVKDEMCQLGARDIVLKSELSPSGLVELVKSRMSDPSESPCK